MTSALTWVRLFVLAAALALFSSGAESALADTTPAVTGVSPSSGPAGTLVTITGTGFTGATSVSFGGALVAPASVTDTQLTATAPAHTAGTVDIQVTNSAGTSAVVAADHFTYTATPAPAVTGVSPSAAPPGTLITISGSGFTGATSVSFGGTMVAPASVTDTQLTAVAPAHAPGQVDIQVTTPGGTSAVTAADHFTYLSASAPTVTGVTPASGAAGTTVLITGSGFTGATSVSFGGAFATPTVNSDTQITVTAPPHTPGTVDVQVTTPLGMSAAVAADRFTYTGGVPTVTGVSPNSGPAGTVVSISGTGFSGATSVSFGGTPATPSSVSETQVIVTAPAHALGQVDVQVITPLGTSAVVAADLFTYTALGAPVVTGVSPTSGVGGTTVTITGTGFSGATSVNFGDTVATPTNVTATQITVIAPPHVAGTVNVTVTTPLGTSVANTASQFTYTASSAPNITGLNPTSGPVTGGNQVVISGTSFTGTTAVMFGTQSATFTVNSDTQITATAPAAASPATVNVQVSVGSLNSANTSATRYTYLSVGPVITSLSPTSGGVAGALVVTLVGTGFTGATNVTFGGVPAIQFTVVTDTAMTAVTPPHAAGIVDVTVITPAGASAGGAATKFAYEIQLCPEHVLWVNDLDYGSPGGGFYWDSVSGQVWTAQRGWHLFSPQPARPHPTPLWVNSLTYGSAGGGFYWDPVSGQVWTAERGWHQFSPTLCIPR